MPQTERKIIPVTAAQASRYVGAIEGLIFDPQPYNPNLSNFPILPETSRSFLRLVGLGSSVEKIPVTDLVKSKLAGRYSDVVADGFYELTNEWGKEDPKEDERVNVYGSSLSIEDERPSLLVEAGRQRRYQVDLKLVSDDYTGIIFSFLHLQQVDAPSAEANLVMCSPYMMRIKRDGQLTESYIPSFEEQQRLLSVNELLRKHMKPLRTIRA